MFRSFEETKNQWNSIKTVSDFITWQNDPLNDVQSFLDKTRDPRAAGFWKAAHIDIPKNILFALSDPDIKHDELNEINRTPSEIKNHKLHNFTTGYNRHQANDICRQIAKTLGFGEDATIYINNQEPGNVVFRHMDYLSCYTHEQEDFLNLEYDQKKKQPKGFPDVWRAFVALDDWHPGQIFQFEPYFWTHWKRGDVVFFDWRNTAHATANCGTRDRPILKITGIIDNDDYVLVARDDNVITSFSLT